MALPPGKNRLQKESKKLPPRKLPDPQMTLLQKWKMQPIKTVTAFLTLITTIAGMVYATLSFVATKNDVNDLANEMVDVAITAYEDNLLEIEYRIASGDNSEYNAVLANHYKRRIEGLKDLRK